MDRIAREVGIKEIGVKLADARKTVFSDPVTPVVVYFTMPSFGPSPPNRVDKHSAKGSDVRGNIGFSADKVVEIVGWWSGEVEMVVDVGKCSKHRRAVAKDMTSGIVEMRAEPAAKVSPVSASISEHHVVGESDNIEASIRREPGRSPSLVAEKMSRVSRLQAHDSTLFVNVLAIGSYTQRRID